jgi:hypothetical protein
MLVPSRVDEDEHRPPVDALDGVIATKRVIR